MRFRPEIFDEEGSVLDIGPSFAEHEQTKAQQWLSTHIALQSKKLFGGARLGTRLVKISESIEETQQLLLEQNGV